MARSTATSVARSAVAVARGLGLEGEQEMTILLGAHLHDLGLMRLPREIRNTTEPLTREELAGLVVAPGVQRIRSRGDSAMNAPSGIVR